VLRKLFERLGVTFIKLGQLIASAPSLFPEEYVEEFQGCLDRADPVPYATVRAILAADLGAPSESVFSSVDERPLASASIAQVGDRGPRGKEMRGAKAEKRCRGGVGEGCVDGGEGRDERCMVVGALKEGRCSEVS
jgi:hypothetical protein